MANTSAPTWASSMVSNWRQLANIPDTITDRAIFAIVNRESLCVRSGNTPEENQAEIEYLRQELGLPNEP